MADTKLFNIKGTVKEYQSGTVTLEKELQTVIENNMNIFFGVTFLASEYRTTDGGRMDSIGIDENHCPVLRKLTMTKTIALSSLNTSGL